MIPFCKHGHNGALFLWSKLMPKHDKDLSGNGKKSVDSSGQCALIRCNGKKKHKYSLKLVSTHAEPRSVEL